MIGYVMDMRSRTRRLIRFESSEGAFIYVPRQDWVAMGEPKEVFVEVSLPEDKS